MSIRQIIFSALAEDPMLDALGITSDYIFPNWSMDNAPSRERAFLIIRFQEQNLKTGTDRGPRYITVWAHVPVQVGNDFDLIDPILRAVNNCFANLDSRPEITNVKFQGTSDDLTDPGYDTITRSIAYDVLVRPGL